MSTTDPFSPADLFRLHFSPRRRFVEILLTDVDDPESHSSTGYLDETERLAVADRLEALAAELRAVKPEAVEPEEAREWEVVGIAMGHVPPSIMLQCRRTKALAYVEDYSRDEWAKAYHAPSAPYLWNDLGRVILSSNVQGKTREELDQGYATFEDGLKADAVALKGAA